MSDVRGTVRAIIRLDGEEVINELVLNEESRIFRIGKGFNVEVWGGEHRIDVEFEFDPPVGQTL